MIVHGSKNGFSLVEMMMAMLATSIMSLAVGSMLYFGWMGWIRNNDSVNMQRDASLAMRVMAREVRKSAMADITLGNNQLGCVNPAGEAVDFTVFGGNLDMAVDGAFSMRLVRGQAVALSTTASNGLRSVTLDLEVAAGDDIGKMVSTIYTRN